jgi:hypothetical protein
LRAAAFAAAICSRRTDDEDFAAVEAGPLLFDATAGFSFFCRGANVSPNAGLVFVGLAASVLLAEGLDGDVAPGDGGTIDFEVWSFDVNDEELTLRLPPGVKPKPPRDVRDAGLALIGAFFAEGRGGFAKVPSLVPGLLLMLLARLMLEDGRGGGPMGLSTEKKLDRRRSFGVDGTPFRLSIVRSDSDGRELLLAFGVSTSGSNTGSYCSSGEASSLKPCLEAERKPSKEPSWSWFSSSSEAYFRGTEDGGGLLSLEAGLSGAARGLGGTFEVAAGFVGLGIALHGVGIVGVRVVLLDLDEGAVADLVCKGGLTLLGLVDVGGTGMALGTGAGAGSCEGFLFPTGSLDKRGMPRGMPVGLAVVCD